MFPSILQNRFIDLHDEIVLSEIKYEKHFIFILMTCNL